jgi:hypothetical protein
MSNRLLLLILLLPVSLLGQSAVSDVSIDDLKMKVYDKDTAANAVMLFDIGTNKILTWATFTERVRIKILKPAGLRHANVVLRGYKGTLKKIRGTTYNLENGVIVKREMADTLVLKTKVTQYIEDRAFALPDVRVGSVIEYQYTLLADDDFFPTWQFQHNIPCKLSEYSLDLNQKLYYEPHFRGELENINHVESNKGKDHVWSVTDVPAFVSEPLMPDIDIYISAVDFIWKRTWLDFYLYLLRSSIFGEVVYDKSFERSQDPFKEEMKYISQITDDETKIKAIIGLVKRSVEWNGHSDFHAHRLQLVIDRKKGSSGDINLLLANLLFRAGYDVKLLLISTRDHGFVMKEMESLSQFNYVICQVTLPAKTLFLDATERLLAFNLLPSRCYNYLGFSIGQKEASWTKIDPSKNKIFVTGNFALTDQGELSGTFNYSSFEQAAFHTRKLRKDFTEEDFNKRLFNESSWSVKKIKTQGLEDVDKPLIEDFEVTIPDFGTVAGNVIYVNPMLFIRQEETTFKSEKRHYPVSLEVPEEKTMSITINIPENYTIDEVPKNMIIGLPNNDAKYIYNISVTGNKIQITSKLQMNTSLFMPEEYPAVKEFYQRLVSKQAETIVLKKIQ